MSNTGRMSVHDLKTRIDEGEDWHVLDVRSIYEYAHAHIEGSTNMDVGSLPVHMTNLPKDKPIAVICATGGRSSMGCRMLMRRGFDQVFNVVGGMSAWILSGYPVA